MIHVHHCLLTIFQEYRIFSEHSIRYAWYDDLLDDLPAKKYFQEKNDSRIDNCMIKSLP